MNALLGEMQLMMAQGASAVPEAPTIVESVPVTTGSTAVSAGVGLSATFTSAIEPGDQVVLEFNAKGNAGSSVLSASDSAGTAYDVRQPAEAESAYGTLAAALSAPFTAAIAAGGLTVTVKANKSAELDMTAHLVRGPRLSIDTANIYADAQTSGQPGTTPFVVGPYNTSGKAFIAMAALTSFANFSFSSGSGYTVDYNAHTYYYPTFAHKITSAAVSGESFSLTTTSSSVAQKSVLLVPMTY